MPSVADWGMVCLHAAPRVQLFAGCIKGHFVCFLVSFCVFGVFSLVCFELSVSVQVVLTCTDTANIDSVSEMNYYVLSEM